MNKFEKILQASKIKQLLAKSDYKVIKCMEAKLLGNELPYDIEEIAAKREEYRKQINELLS